MNLGGLGLYRKAKNIFGRSYDNEKHWLRKGETWLLDTTGTHPMDELIQYLKTITFDSVLEFGCGTGITTKAILDNFKPNNYTAFDLSPHQLYNAKFQCKDYNVDFQCSTIQEFNTEKKFDLVIGTSVLHHISPKDITNTIKHLLNFCKKYVIDVGVPYQEQFHVLRTTHTFRHNYRQIYSKIPYVDYSLQMLSPTSCLHIIKIKQQNLD